MRNRIFNDKKLVIASHNQGKIREIRELLGPLNINILSAYELGIEEPEENGKTFEENALIKSKFVSKKTQLPCISDDSGICFTDLNNKPGIYSARLAREKGSFYKAMKYILKRMKKVKKRNATFVCSLSYKKENGKIITVEGKIEGNISNKIKGKIGTFSFKNGKVTQDLDIYKTDNNKFTKF